MSFVFTNTVPPWELWSANASTVLLLGPGLQIWVPQWYCSNCCHFLPTTKWEKTSWNLRIFHQFPWQDVHENKRLTQDTADISELSASSQFQLQHTVIWAWLWFVESAHSCKLTCPHSYFVGSIVWLQRVKLCFSGTCRKTSSMCSSQDRRQATGVCTSARTDKALKNVGNKSVTQLAISAVCLKERRTWQSSAKNEDKREMPYLSVPSATRSSKRVLTDLHCSGVNLANKVTSSSGLISPSFGRNVNSLCGWNTNAKMISGVLFKKFSTISSFYVSQLPLN